MTTFDAQYWHLAQAAAWVIYRERELVEQLAHADEAAFTAISMYPSMWPAERKKHGQLSGLQGALIEGRLAAKGYRNGLPSKLAAIPSEDWHDLNLRPPCAYDTRYPGRKSEPWTHIRVASADVKRLWRSPIATNGRTRFDWAAVRELYERANEANPDFSQNELILEAQSAFEEKFHKNPPSRSAFQRQIKSWK